jgi:hypothetical protein
LVKDLNDTQTSFEKILSGDTWLIQATKIIKNNKDDFIINP